MGGYLANKNVERVKEDTYILQSTHHDR